MRDVRHILVPTDFSTNSLSAIPAARSWARRHGAVVHLLHVIAPLPWPVHQVLDQERIPLLNAELRRRCRARLEEVRAGTGDGIESELHVVEGLAADRIARFAAEHEVDLLVLATHGYTGLKRFRLGSTAEKVVRTAGCPVLVVRSSPVSWGALRRIVVPTDFRPLSNLAVTEAAELARAHGADLVLVHVLEKAEYPIGQLLEGHGIADIRERAAESARLRLEGAQLELIGPEPPSKALLRDGTPAIAIAELAETEAADLVVIATHGREGVARFVLGSTAERVVRIAPCSVLVVKERER